MKAPKSTIKYHLLPEGTHQGVCFGVWDLGWQKTTFQGKEKIKPQVMIAWETSDRVESSDDYNGQRYRVYKKYTFNMGDKSNLCKDVQGWVGALSIEDRDDFEFESLVGKNCLLNIVHKEGDEKTFVNIAGVAPLLKGIPLMTPENKPEAPDWVKEIQSKSVPPEDQPEHHVAEEGKIPF